MAVRPQLRKKKSSRETIGYFNGTLAVIDGRRGRPFFRIQIPRASAKLLVASLKKIATQENHRFTLASIMPQLNRMTLTRPNMPNYERWAARNYVRGDTLVISGGRQSCNITFTGGVGARSLAEQISAALSRCKSFLELRIPYRRRNLVEFIPDGELSAAGEKSDIAFGLAGESLGAMTLEAEDFSDWED